MANGKFSRLLNPVEEPFFYASTLLEEKPLVSVAEDAYLSKFSPDGKKLAYIEGRRTLKILDFTTKATVTLLTPEKLFHMSDGDLDFSKFLNRKADKFTLLEVLDPKASTRKQITIKPITIAQENQLLYKRYVKKNQQEVDGLSGGKLGYVHIPGMSDGPYRNVYEEMMGKYHDTKGGIVDTRFNGGGDLVADLAMFFTGQQFLTYATEAKEVGYEPTARWTKPTLAMFNEANYSDGPCFACGYTDLKIGKTVGMPTPGTCSFAGWEGLPDGSRWGAVPISAKNMAGYWLENNETKPQFQVKNMPGQIDKGIDKQLEKAVEELLKDEK